MLQAENRGLHIRYNENFGVIIIFQLWIREK